MKKLIYSTFFALFIILASCQSINNSLNVISKCMMLSVADNEKAEQSEKESERSKNTAILPINSWDGKMLIW